MNETTAATDTVHLVTAAGTLVLEGKDQLLAQHQLKCLRTGAPRAVLSGTEQGKLWLAAKLPLWKRPIRPGWRIANSFSHVSHREVEQLDQAKWRKLNSHMVRPTEETKPEYIQFLMRGGLDHSAALRLADREIQVQRQMEQII